MTTDESIEFLRTIYSSRGLSIRPKMQLSKIETPKRNHTFLRIEPEEILTCDALSQPNRTVIMPNIEKN
jgi:hypothetical protein